MRFFDIKLLDRIFGPKRDEVTDEQEKNYTMRSLIV